MEQEPASADDLTDAAEASGITWDVPRSRKPDPDWYDLWVQAGGNPVLYRRLCVAATEEEALPDLPHEPGSDYCGVGGPPRTPHPEPCYRRCSCGRWYYWTSRKWAPGRPTVHWLREHSPDLEDFWTPDDDEGPRFFEDFAVSRPPLLMFLRWLFQRQGR